jgi:competence protein ComEC
LWQRAPPIMTRLSRRRFAGLAAGACALAYVALAGWGLPAQRTLYMVLAMAWAQQPQGIQQQLQYHHRH